MISAHPSYENSKNSKARQQRWISFSPIKGSSRGFPRPVVYLIFLIVVNITTVSFAPLQVQSNLPLERVPTDQCALCFFGLPRAFEELVLPSIIQNVLIPNHRYNCDIYVHFYEKYNEDPGRKNTGGQLNPKSVLLLDDAVRRVRKQQGNKLGSTTNRTQIVKFTNDTEEQFWEKYRPQILEYQTANHSDGKPLYFPYKERSYTFTSIQNMVKQWHSIQSSFQLMTSNTLQQARNYSRVAMLRLDVMYLTPIDIYVRDRGVFDEHNQYVSTPGFCLFPVNDRMVYGPFRGVQVWATQRFNLINERAKTQQSRGRVMHSERFVKESILPKIASLGFHLDVNRDICFTRTRPDMSVFANECTAKGSVRGWRDTANTRRAVEAFAGRPCTQFRLDKLYLGLQCGFESSSSLLY